MDDDDVEREERAICLIVIIVLAPVVIVAIVGRAAFNGGTTLCLISSVLGAVGILASIVRALRRPRLPRAQLHASSSRWSS